MADSASARLARCFAAVFPELPPDVVPDASTASVPAWDSLANATLVTVVEEEFGLEVPLEQLPELDSFGRWLAFVEGAAATA